MKFLAPLVAAFIPEMDIAFSNFQRTFGKKYPDSELPERRAIFTTNLNFMTKFNSDPDGLVTVGVGPFADLTEREFKYYVSRGRVARKDGRRPSAWGQLKHLGTFKHNPTSDMPKSVNWIEKGGVTEVKDQGACGSCWSFSTTGALEGRYFAHYNKLIELSEQNLLDCDNSDERCNGGLMDYAFTYVKENGLCTEESYSYKCADEDSEECSASKCHSGCDIGIKPHMIVGYQDITHDEISLMQAVIEGPVSVAIEADARVFQHYTGGVLTNPNCGSELDHGVLCVGYGVEENDGTEYWLVKNSWGTEWGVRGYIKVGRGYWPDDDGECGILKMASYPVFTDEPHNTIFA